MSPLESRPVHDNLPTRVRGRCACPATTAAWNDRVSRCSRRRSTWSRSTASASSRWRRWPRASGRAADTCSTTSRRATGCCWRRCAGASRRTPTSGRPSSRARRRPDVSAVVEFADVYLAIDEKDPRWQLWLELWARAPYHPELAEAQREIDSSWHVDLVRLL